MTCRYPSNYLTGGRSVLPAFPLRRACEALAPDFGGDADALLEALSDATLVVNNASGAAWSEMTDLATPLIPPRGRGLPARGRPR